MSIFNEFFKKEKPFFTGITRGIGGFGFGGGGGDPILSLEASGGNVDGAAPGDGYKYHVFNAPGTLTINSVDGGLLEVILVGGGGGGKAGGDSAGGGGGAGGLVYRHSIPVEEGNTFPISIGSGGSDGPGTDSTGFSLTAKGGGRGSGRYGPAVDIGAQPGGSGGSASNFGHGRGDGIQPSQNPGVSNLTQYGNEGWQNGDTSPYKYTDNTGGSSNLNNEGSPAFGQIPSAQLPFPGQPGGSTILSGAPWGPTRHIALGGFYVPGPPSTDIRPSTSYGCGGHGTPTSNTGGVGGVCVVRYVPTSRAPN